MSTALTFFREGQALTTTEVIAKGVKNQHKNVLGLARKYMADLSEFGQVAFETRLNQQGSGTEYALLNEHQATLLLTYMKNTAIVRKFKKQLVKAFFEMRDQLSSQLPDFSNPVEAARAWANEVEQKQLAQQQSIEHEKQIEAMKPDVEVVERIVKSYDNMCITDAAKVLKIKPYKLRDWLYEHGWIYDRSTSKNKKKWKAYQPKLDQGLLFHRITPYYDSSTEEQRLSYQVLVTSKGLAKLADLLNQDDAA